MDPASDSKPHVCFEVEKIIGMSSDGNVRSYRVQWAPAWVSSFHLIGCEHLIQDYLQGSPRKESRRESEMRAIQGFLHGASDTKKENRHEALQGSFRGSIEKEIRPRNERGVHMAKDSIKAWEHSQSEKLVPNLERVYNSIGMQHENPSQHAERSLVDQESTSSGKESLGQVDDSFMPNALLKLGEEIDEETRQNASDRLNEPSSCLRTEKEDDNRDIDGELDTERTLDNSDEMEDDVKVYILTPEGEMNDSPTHVNADYNEQLLTDDYVHKPVIINNTVPSSQQSHLDRDIPLSTHAVRKDSEDVHQSPNASPPSSSHSRTAEVQHLTSDSTFSSPVYPCSTCHKIFSSKNQLDMHFRCHSGERPYICSYCGKAYSQKGNLNRHIRGHMGVKPYECEICSKAFAQKGHLRDHVLTHSGLKPYQCNLCEKAYIRKNHLKEHLQTHGVEAQ